MIDTARGHLEWPFFEPRHRELSGRVRALARGHIAAEHPANVDAECRALVELLGANGLLAHAIGGTAYGGASEQLDTRALCLIREALAERSALADFAFGMQGLGSGAITLFGTDEQKAAYLPRVVRGSAIAAFALSEREAGSDAAALQCAATLDGDAYVVRGEKLWVSNGGIADFYVVFVRTGEAAGAKGVSALIVDANAPGLEVAERIDVIAPHPLARLTFANCRVPVSRMLGKAGEGFTIAMATLDVFRTSVAAAAIGLARRAFDAAMGRVTTRKLFGHALGEMQLTQAKLAAMATDIDAAALLTYRAAWMRDCGRSITVEAAMAKMAATEAAQRVIDAAVQIFGGQGVVSGEPVEQLYREIRPLRIYEGATELQQLIIGRGVIRAYRDSVPAGA